MRLVLVSCGALALLARPTLATCRSDQRGTCKWSPLERSETASPLSRDAATSSLWAEDDTLSLIQRAAHMELKKSGLHPHEVAFTYAAREKAAPVVAATALEAMDTIIAAERNSTNLVNASSTNDKLDRELEAAVNYVMRWLGNSSKSPTSPLHGVNALVRVLAAPVRLTSRLGLPWQLALVAVLLELITVIFISCLIFQSLRRKK